MPQISETQVKFLTFAETLTFLNQLNSDLDPLHPTPDNAVWSRRHGVVAGVTFPHLCYLMNDVFDFKLQPTGCIQAWDGYLLTFSDSISLNKSESEEVKDDLENKTKRELIELAKEMGLELDMTMNKASIIEAMKSA